MKVLAAVVLAPHWEAAGGFNAALRLSTALAKICDIDLARMAAADSVEERDGLTVFDRRCENRLSAIRGLLPRSLLPCSIGRTSRSSSGRRPTIWSTFTIRCQRSKCVASPGLPGGRDPVRRVDARARRVFVEGGG